MSTPDSLSMERDVQVLEFRLGEERFCVDIADINEIVEKGQLTGIPNTADHVLGVMDLRGETTTIVDPKQVLDVADVDTGERVIIFESDDARPIGWLVDSVHEVSTLGEEDVESVGEDAVVKGVISQGDRFVVWVEPDAVHATNKSRTA